MSVFPLHDLPSLARVFEIKAKRELEAYCRTLEIHADDFANLILAIDLGAGDPYLHQRYNRHLQPEHLLPADCNFEALREAEVGEPLAAVGKFSRKIEQLFTDRRFLVGHLFHTSDYKYWQFFYFDQRDMAEFDNHWTGGAHIHLVNDLWPGLSAKDVVDGFMAEKPRMPTSLHIRFNNGEFAGG